MSNIQMIIVYSDRIYIEIIKIIAKEDIGIIPQQNDTGKIQNIRAILKYLSSLLDIELGHIDRIYFYLQFLACDIILKQDKDSVKYLLIFLIDILNLIKESTEEHKEMITTLTTEDYESMIMSNTAQNDLYFVKRKLDACSSELDYINKSNQRLEPKIDNDIDNYKNIGELYPIDKLTEKDIIKPSTQNDNIKEEGECDIDTILQSSRKENETNDSPSINVYEDNGNNIRKEIIMIARKLLSPRQYQMLTISQKEFNNKISTIIHSIIMVQQAIYPNKNLTHNFLQIHMKEVHEIIIKTLEKATLNSKMITKIVNSMIKDKEFLRKLFNDDSDVVYHDHVKKQQTYNTLREKSYQNISKMTQIYQAAFALEEEKCLEEKKNQEEICINKEAKVIEENLLSNDTKKQIHQHFAQSLIHDKMRRKRVKRLSELQF